MVLFELGTDDIVCNDNENFAVRQFTLENIVSINETT